MIFGTGLNAYSVEGYVFSANDVKPAYSQSLQISNAPYGEYFKYYNLNNAKIDAEFINLSKSEEEKFLKTLTKEEKENYKYVKKVQKLIEKNDWNKVFEKYPNFLPAYLQYYDLNYEKNNYGEAIRILTKIRKLDARGQVVPKSLVDYSFGILYFASGQYNMALNYFMMYEKTGDDFVLANIANCYYMLGNNTAVIEYCKKLQHPQYQDKELLYNAYYNLKNYTQANKYAQELLKENYCFDNLMRFESTTLNDNEKLSYAYKARAVAQNDNQIKEANRVIAGFEQAKLNKAVSKLTQFVKVPTWSEFEKQILFVPATELARKQDEFFRNANNYLTKYSAQQLTNAFNSLNQDYTNYVQDKKNEYYQQQQLEAQKALVLEQQRNNMLQQEMIREQQIRNHLERQQFYYMSRPYYYYHYRPRFYVW